MGLPDVVKTVGRYEILRDLGRGGMSIVYLARQTDLDRFVALKELGAFHASDPAVAQRFLRESQMAGGLSHPNIAVVYDYFQHDGTPYIAMEYVERGSLRPHVGHMTLAQVAGVLEGLLAGLAHAEQHEIVHRDLKPENLMITADGRVKIADFGIAKATNRMQTSAFLTATGTTVGTPTYMAPEQAMAQEIGPWTDLYSVGVMAFEMFVGRTPFHESEAPMAILLRHVKEEIPAVRSLVPEVDERISAWIQRLLVKDPKRRTRSATAAWDELEELVIAQLGPRWRRQARLVERATQIDTPKPLTPAPFQGTSAGDAVADEFRSLPVGPDTPVDTPTAPPGRTPVVVTGKTAEPSAVPAPAALARRSRRFVVIVAATAVAAAVAGFVLASSDGDEAGGAAMASGPVSVRAPDGWSQVARPPAIPGLAGATTVAPGGRAGGPAVAFALVSRVDPALLLPGDLAEGRPRRAAVRLSDGVEAYRYADLRPRGLDRPVTVYAVPTSRGVATVACLDAGARCEEIAGTLRLASLTAYPVGPSEDYATTVGRRLSDLRSAAERRGRRLERAPGPKSRAREARGLASVHDRAAGAIRNVGTRPADRALSGGLADALERIGRGYTGLAAAARAGDRGRDRSARDAIRDGERGLTGGLDRLEAAGYRLGG